MDSWGGNWPPRSLLNPMVKAKVATIIITMEEKEKWERYLA